MGTQLGADLSDGENNCSLIDPLRDSRAFVAPGTYFRFRRRFDDDRVPPLSTPMTRPAAPT